jgi:hypothetical protein
MTSGPHKTDSADGSMRHHSAGANLIVTSPRATRPSSTSVSFPVPSPFRDGNVDPASILQWKLRLPSPPPDAVDPGQLLTHAAAPEQAKRFRGGELDEERRREHEAAIELVLRHNDQDLGKSLKPSVLIG